MSLVSLTDRSSRSSGRGERSRTSKGEGDERLANREHLDSYLTQKDTLVACLDEYSLAHSREEWKPFVISFWLDINDNTDVLTGLMRLGSCKPESKKTFFGM